MSYWSDLSALSYKNRLPLLASFWRSFWQVFWDRFTGKLIHQKSWVPIQFKKNDFLSWLFETNLGQKMKKKDEKVIIFKNDFCPLSEVKSKVW